MSDVPVSVTTAVEVAQPVVESSGSIWGYVAGGVAVLVLAAVWGYKKINTPSFIISQVRRRNLKEMKKQGVENSALLDDLNLLLDAVLEHANENKLKGSDVVKTISRLNDSERVKSPRDIYQAMIGIASQINATDLARDLKMKSSQVKASSPLMAGLFKRAGIQ